MKRCPKCNRVENDETLDETLPNNQNLMATTSLTNEATTMKKLLTTVCLLIVINLVAGLLHNCDCLWARDTDGG